MPTNKCRLFIFGVIACLLTDSAISMPSNKNKSKSRHSDEEEKIASRINLRPEYQTSNTWAQRHGVENSGQKQNVGQSSGGAPFPMTQRQEMAIGSRTGSRERYASGQSAPAVAAAEGSNQSAASGAPAAVYKPPHVRQRERNIQQQQQQAPNKVVDSGSISRGSAAGTNNCPVSAITHPGDRSPYTNTDQRPSQERQHPFLYEQNEDQMRTYHNYEHEDSGKWMMFFKNGRELDEKWAKAKQLYNEGKLAGITSMKVSTAYENPRASDKRKGVVIFYCGPCGDEQKMLSIGLNLMAHVPYAHHMPYKADWQTMEGTRATGVKKNHLYKIDPSIVHTDAEPSEAQQKKD